jgi:hypothetical protein
MGQKSKGGVEQLNCEQWAVYTAAPIPKEMP